MRNKFDEQLNLLNQELIRMGNYVETAIATAVKTLTAPDQKLTQQAVGLESEIDDKEREIESICYKLLLHQQPVARDLRVISAALKMITDMERIGDMAMDISEITLSGEFPSKLREPVHISQMAASTIEMVNNSIEAYVKKDASLAFSVIDADDKVDALFQTVQNELVELIREDRNSGAGAMDLLMIAKYFERIGDHATNIAEWVVFSITGEHPAN